MPTPEQNKEAMETLRELAKAVDATPPEERGPVPSIDELQSGDGSKSIFQAEQVSGEQTQVGGVSAGVKVIENAGGDGMEDSSTREILRELVQVARAIQSELIELGQG